MTPNRPTITPDSREPKTLLTALAFEGEVARVTVHEPIALFKGDYLIRQPNGRTIMVERKTLPDFFSSVIDRRIFEQGGILAEDRELSEVVIILEGHPWGNPTEKGIARKRTGLHPNSFRGALLWLLRKGLRVLLSRDQADTIAALMWLAKSAPPEETE